MIWPQCFYLSCFTPGATKLSEVLLWASHTGSEPLAGAQPNPGPRFLTSMFGHVHHTVACAVPWSFFKSIRISRSGSVSTAHGTLQFRGFFVSFFFFFFFPRREDRIPRLPVLVVFALQEGQRAPWAESRFPRRDCVLGYHGPSQHASGLLHFTGVAFYFCKSKARPTCSRRTPTRFRSGLKRKRRPGRDLEA